MTAGLARPDMPRDVKRRIVDEEGSALCAPLLSSVRDVAIELRVVAPQAQIVNGGADDLVPDDAVLGVVFDLGVLTEDLDHVLEREIRHAGAARSTAIPTCAFPAHDRRPMLAQRRRGESLLLHLHCKRGHVIVRRLYAGVRSAFERHDDQRQR